MDKLKVDDEIRAGITVRGYSGAQAIDAAKPRLDEWQSQRIDCLPDNHHFDARDSVSPPASGHQIVTRTLKVVADEEPA